MFCLDLHFISALGTSEAGTELDRGQNEKWSDGKRHEEKDIAQEDPLEKTEVDTVRGEKAKVHF